MLSEFICQCPGIQNDASCSVRVTNSSAILCGCFSTSKVATQVKGVGVRCTRGSVRLSDIQAVRKHLNDSNMYGSFYVAVQTAHDVFVASRSS